MGAPSLSDELRMQRSKTIASRVQDVALQLFDQHGFTNVTVEAIASAARISPRTFYRYFATKEDVFQWQIDRRTEALRRALAERPRDEPPLRSLRVAYEQVLESEDAAAVRRWVNVAGATPGLLRPILGGIQLKTNQLIAEFFADRLGLAPDHLVPTMLSAAAGGVLLAAHTRWYLVGGDLVATVSKGLDVLDRALATDPESWTAAAPDDDWPIP